MTDDIYAFVNSASCYRETGYRSPDPEIAEHEKDNDDRADQPDNVVPEILVAKFTSD